MNPSSEDAIDGSTDEAAVAELHRFLSAYRPSDVTEPSWLRLAAEAADLVFRAGAPTRLRVEKDIQCVGHVVAHLIERGRVVTLDAVLADTTLHSYDTTLQKNSAGVRTRENQRGILRRLQAVHRGLPWRQPRRADGERIAAMIQPRMLEVVRRLEVAAAAASQHVTTVTVSPDSDEAAYLVALDAARLTRAGTTSATAEATWAAARRFAARHGVNLTRPIVAAAVTYEALEDRAPIAVLAGRFGLTRRDLDLALTQASALPQTPSPEDRHRLRGTGRPV